MTAYIDEHRVALALSRSAGSWTCRHPPTTSAPPASGERGCRFGVIGDLVRVRACEQPVRVSRRIAAGEYEEHFAKEHVPHGPAGARALRDDPRVHEGEPVGLIDAWDGAGEVAQTAPS